MQTHKRAQGRRGAPAVPHRTPPCWTLVILSGWPDIHDNEAGKQGVHQMAFQNDDGLIGRAIPISRPTAELADQLIHLSTFAFSFSAILP